jgi:hypothetical protein
MSVLWQARTMLKVVRPSSDRQLDADPWVRAVTDRDTQTRTPRMSLARIEQRFARIRWGSGDLMECSLQAKLSGPRLHQRPACL